MTGVLRGLTFVGSAGEDGNIELRGEARGSTDRTTCVSLIGYRKCRERDPRPGLSVRAERLGPLSAAATRPTRICNP